MALYFASLCLSLFTAVMTISMMFDDKEQEISRFFGETEIGICLVVSVVLLLIGVLKDKR